jgi:hypothetical protein
MPSDMLYNSRLITLEDEGLALLDAIHLASCQEWDYVMFESDSQILINSKFCSLKTIRWHIQ